MLNDEVKAIWNANAEFWDSRMGEGNDFHKTLIEPTQLRLLNIKPGQRILDVACGNGQFARKMAGLGALVTGIDFSKTGSGPVCAWAQTGHTAAIRQAQIGRIILLFIVLLLPSISSRVSFWPPDG